MCSSANLSQTAKAAMCGFARGDTRVFNVLSLRFVHNQSLRRIAGSVGVSKNTVKRWCDEYASAAKDFCTLEGISPTEFVRAA